MPTMKIESTCIRYVVCLKKIKVSVQNNLNK